VTTGTRRKFNTPTCQPLQVMSARHEQHVYFFSPLLCCSQHVVQQHAFVEGNLWCSQPAEDSSPHPDVTLIVLEYL